MLNQLTIRMLDDLDDLGFTPSSDLTIQSLEEIDTTSPELPAPALVANAVVPKVRSSKGRERIGGVTHEAARSMRVHSKHERNKQMMGIPEGFKGLLTDLGMCGGVHEQHAKKHDVTCDTTSLGVVDLDGSNRTNLTQLNIEEAIAMVLASM